jgi:hypothetical protein
MRTLLRLRRLPETPMAAIAGGHRAKLKIIVTRGNPSLAGLAATYSSKP